MNWKEELKKVVQQKRITIFRFSESEWSGLLKSKHGISEFTFTREHVQLRSTDKRSICLLVGETWNGECLFIGAVANKSTVSTLETRVKICGVNSIEPGEYSELITKTKNYFHDKSVYEQLYKRHPVVRLSSRGSVEIIDFLSQYFENENALQHAFKMTSTLARKDENKVLQNDAIRTALKIFDLSIDSEAKLLELVDDRDTALEQVRILEDAVIEHDARSIPGLQFQSSDVTGRAIFAAHPADTS